MKYANHLEQYIFRQNDVNLEKKIEMKIDAFEVYVINVVHTWQDFA